VLRLRARASPELEIATCALAVRFAALGPRARVIVVAHNGPALACALLAALRSGAEVLGVPPRTPPAALADLAHQLGAKLVLAEPRLGGGESLAFDALLRAPRTIDGPRDFSGAVLLTTSGTTGFPRIVRRSVRAVDFIARTSAEALALGPGDRSLLAIPLFHSYGLDQLTAALLAGARAVLHAGFNPALVRRELAEGGITHLPAVPTMVDALARLAGDQAASAVLRCVVSAGSALSERVARAFEEKLGVAVGQVYGSSELGTVTATRAGDPLGCVGRALPGVTLRVLDRAAPNPEKPVAIGEEGIVAVAAPSRFDGYVGSADAPAELVNTGDLGRLDDAGRLWLNGRASLLIDVGAVKVNSLEVEALLLGHPDVRDVVVLPLPFSDTGARLRAVVVPEPGRTPTRDALRRYARERLIDYKVPRVFEIREDVPRSPTGKILRGELLREPR